MRKSQNKFDERQLQARSTAFKWMSFTFIIELTVWCFLKDLLLVTAEPMGELMILLFAPFLVFGIICVVKDAYDPIGGRPGMVVFTIFPLTGMIFIALKLLKQRTPLIIGRCITADGGLIFFYSAWIIIAAVYWIKYVKDTKEELRGED